MRGPWGDPRFYTPEGREIDLEVMNDVPYLPRHFVTAWTGRKSVPAVADGEDHSSAAAAESAGNGHSSAAAKENAGEGRASAADAASSSGAASAEAPQSAPAPAAASDEVEKTCKITAEPHLTHLPKHPKCHACQMAKMQLRHPDGRTQRLNKRGSSVPKSHLTMSLPCTPRQPGSRAWLMQSLGKIEPPVG